ncbi:MAG: cyclic nucleotide-binding domain-containing protein [Chloroflexi bacterium]|nr:cyclic nucleotide-binding domain-containing protein [Chloroflexota bacterium]
MEHKLRKVPLFADLSDDDLDELSKAITTQQLEKGEMLFEEGDQGVTAYVIDSGEIEILKISENRQVLLNVLGPGDVFGEMALLDESPRMAGARAGATTTLLAIKKTTFDGLLDHSPSAARAMFDTVVARLRSTEGLLRQSERMAQLGTLTAGVAHELNNPAAAVKRGAAQLADSVEAYARSQRAVAGLALSHQQEEMLGSMLTEASSAAISGGDIDPLDRSDLEYEMQGWLEQRNVTDAWQVGPGLVDAGYTCQKLDSLEKSFGLEAAAPVAVLLSKSASVNALLTEIGQASSQISDIVGSLKTYSFLDQAPVQTVDIAEGVDSSLLMLRSKLKMGIQVHREYADDVPKIQAYGSELNQVWTNIIDNAADAMEGNGKLTVRIYSSDVDVIVEIEDNGPGIPQEIQHRIFDSFFTTKEPGKGTGLGLDITYNIVIHKHRGDITVLSEPGRTCFQVTLPIKGDLAGQVASDFPPDRDTAG